MRLLRLSSMLFVLLSLSSLSSCKHKEQVRESSPAFRHYIAGYTSGIISNSDPIRVELTEARDVKAGDTAKEKLFRFEPPIEGTVFWEDPYTVVFRPARRLPNGQAFRAEFRLGRLMKVPDSLAVFPFGFRTRTQSLEVKVDGLRSYDNRHWQWNKLDGTLTTADFAGDQAVEKCVEVWQYGKLKPLTWQHDGEHKMHKFTADSIRRGENDGKVVIKWNGQPIGADVRDETVVPVPSINSFKVMKVEVQSAPSQVITVYFSDPLDSRQNLEGLVKLGKDIPVRINVRGNVVNLYPRYPVRGSVTLTLDKHIRNPAGRSLKTDYKQILRFSRPKPALEAVGEGNIVPRKGGRLVFPFKAVSLKGVHVKIIRIFSHNVHQFFQV
ncbi:MAG: hypothetical protein GXO24_03650, partial [Chlorobi bacterium]|nr:hypothetical protein [Chlorobiota bacterium]